MCTCFVYTLIKLTRVHTYTHAHMHTCTHAHMHTCTHAHMHTCTHIHYYTHTLLHTHTHTHHVHTHMHTHSHSLTHTHTQRQWLRKSVKCYWAPQEVEQALAVSGLYHLLFKCWPTVCTVHVLYFTGTLF